MRDGVTRLVAPLGGDTSGAVDALLALLEPRLEAAPVAEPLALLIVSGPPGAGKSTLARALAPRLGVPYLDRDELKDAMFDALGWSDRAWSMRVGGVSWDLMYLFAKRALSTNRNVLLESNFDKRGHPERLPALRSCAEHVLVEVWCRASAEVLNERYWRRWDGGGRHPGHVQDTAFARDALWGDPPNGPPTGVADHLVQVDTTDPATVNVDAVASRVSELIEEGP